MTETATIDNPVLSENSAAAMEQLQGILAAYNETTNRLHHSYQQLKAEVIRLRGELKEKNEQLERKSRLAALGEMAAGMAHEIRNPLGGVQLYASLLERELVGQDKPLGWVHKISKGVNTLDAIVNDILAFTQDQECSRTRANVSALLMEVMDYLAPHIRSKQVSINTGGVQRDVWADIDINMMRRVLLNLLLNAIYAVDKQGIIDVAIGPKKDSKGYSLHISISDNGPGIAAEIRNKIFNPFFTTKDSGTGLGLAIVHRLIECHGGVISVGDSRRGGAKFTILLP